MKQYNITPMFNEAAAIQRLLNLTWSLKLSIKARKEVTIPEL